MGPLIDRLCKQSAGVQRQWRLRLRAAYAPHAVELAEACRSALAFLGVRVGDPEAGQLPLSTRSGGVTDELIEARFIQWDGAEVPLSRIGVLEFINVHGTGEEHQRRQCVQSILDNLESLFNSDPIESGVNLTAFPSIRSSVLNYGIGLGTGRSISTVNPREFEAAVGAAIRAFEPRLDAQSVMVSMVSRPVDDVTADIQIVIEATLRGQVGGVPMRVLTDIDMVNGRVRSRAA
ncbi:MAG TPA: GPW/gp25 family protein [Chiayiivirga sp.]|nr:GPW/gp25 family protein [Chiayiivirga sp.]